MMMKIGRDQQILVELGEYQFCVDLDEVISIIQPPKMVRLPSARGAFIRAFKYQDELGAAVSMRVKLDLPEREDMSSGQILLGRLNGRLAGFWFDHVNSILRIGDGAEWYHPSEGSGLPGDEFDTFVNHQGRLIPHSSLMGLIRFQHAESFKRWWEQDKPQLEARLHQDEEGQGTENISTEAVKSAAATASLDVSTPMDGYEGPLISLDEFYDLMDEAGIDADDKSSPAPQEEPQSQESLKEIPPPEINSDEINSDEIEDEAQRHDVTPADETHEDPVQIQQGEKDIASMDQPPTENPLAVAIMPADSREAFIQALDEVAEDPDDDGIKENNKEDSDALFKLERKREKFRKRLEQRGEANPVDYSIIKVSGKSLLRKLRKWSMRTLLLLLLLSGAAIGYSGYHYIQQNGSPLERVLVKDEAGRLDWSASAGEMVTESQRYWEHVRQRLRTR
ncbi:MAG: chemotaxis protein CheW [Gammaproteobacteria bacterium]|nr:chemotaxis protein CheW [Gammaproteobacteria bacterium]